MHGANALMTINILSSRMAGTEGQKQMPRTIHAAVAVVRPAAVCSAEQTSCLRPAVTHLEAQNAQTECSHSCVSSDAETLLQRMHCRRPLAVLYKKFQSCLRSNHSKAFDCKFNAGPGRPRFCSPMTQYNHS